MPERIGRYLAPVEVAHALKVNQKTVQGWLRDPDHPLVGKKIGQMWRIHEDDFRKFLEGEMNDDRP